MVVCLEEGVCDCRECLLLVSNRGPFEYRATDAGRTEVVPGQSGVATALRVAAEFRPTVWLSSPMNAVERFLAINGSAGSSCPGRYFVPTDERAYSLYYDTFASQVLWFLQHDIAWPPRADGQPSARGLGRRLAASRHPKGARNSLACSVDVAPSWLQPPNATRPERAA